MTLSSGKCASIAGSSSGIGEATALLLARAGILVALVNLVNPSEDKLEKVTRSAQQHGVEAKSYCCDLPRVSRARQQTETIAAQFGLIDLFVDRVGMVYTSSLTQTLLADWQRVLNLNLTGFFDRVRTILPSTGERRHRTSVSVASISTIRVFPLWGIYSVSKWGLMALSKTLSKTLALKAWDNRIWVGSIGPGAVNISICDTETVRSDFPGSTMLNPQTVAQMILQVVQLPPQAVIEERILVSNAGVL